MKPGISFIIQKPSPDLDTESYQGNKVYIRGAVAALDFGDTDQLGILIPHHVIQFVRKSFENDRYRAEILDGDTLYKFYRKPPRSLVPKEEDNTALEKFQSEQRVLEKFKAKNPGIIPGGAGSGPISDVEFEEGHEPEHNGLNQEIISGEVLGERVSVRCLDRCENMGLCLNKKQCQKINLPPIPLKK